MREALAQAWPGPSAPRPIVVIGAGGIVADAHLPAYRLAGLPVAGLFDIDGERAAATAARFGLSVFPSLEAALAVDSAVFDLALPPAAHLGVIERLPAGSPVLIQKPLGRDLAEASAILAAARRRGLLAAVNFQLRFAPMMLALADWVAQGRLGEIVEAEMHVNVLTPWHLWPFLQGLERMEIALHSIHYLDLMRRLLGDPAGVHAKTIGHPASTLAQTRTSAILDYGERLRCVLSVNHHHDFGRKFQDSSLRLEGTRGCAVARLGVNLDYPRGEPDELWLCETGGEWESVPLRGTWFPHAFIGPMSNLQRFAAGEDETLVTAVADAWKTMALVEACFTSSSAPATPIAPLPEAR
ncbi:Gfo/Idh/MocA family protein [Labrys wisconsinensis]|uniref:Dehydrogenase n=1 Tax=Labrys wisconsinensis TaxID=425677 RepID=A0ABU0JC43_9HYPH|nr:Gfo/Idh/MocA family oxidoreductase [Labrys wisconsinensis]MDQ0471848.1 putative dehydrogenase [Labrys wisconsinensis]